MVSKLCYKCHINFKMSDKSKYCKSCHSENMKDWRKTHKLSGIAKLKDIVRSYANTYFKRGKLIQPECCEKCKEKCLKLHKHHYDYNKPLEIYWVCKDCHKWIHKNESDKIIEPKLD